MTKEIWWSGTCQETLVEREDRRHGNLWIKRHQFPTLIASVVCSRKNRQKHHQAQHQLRVFDVKATAEASSSSAPVEEFDVEAELSTMNNQEIQAVRIISENAWHLWQAGVLSLRTIDGQKVENQFCEVVTVLREFWRMSES